MISRANASKKPCTLLSDSRGALFISAYFATRRGRADVFFCWPGLAQKERKVSAGKSFYCLPSHTAGAATKPKQPVTGVCGVSRREMDGRNTPISGECAAGVVAKRRLSRPPAATTTSTHTHLPAVTRHILRRRRESGRRWQLETCIPAGWSAEGPSSPPLPRRQLKLYDV